LTWDRVNPLITGVITHLLSGMSHQLEETAGILGFPKPVGPAMTHTAVVLTRISIGQEFTNGPFSHSYVRLPKVIPIIPIVCW
jgi:hypothetical protein